MVYSILVVVKITTLKTSLYIVQHEHVVKVQKTLCASFYNMSSSSVKDVGKHIIISSFYDNVTVPTSLTIDITQRSCNWRS
jgi:hypothetical protein